MREMFLNADDFNQDIGGWDVSNVNNMREMFAYNASFNQDIGSWDVSNVEYMNEMFAYNASFNQDIGGWDVSNVINMSEMFRNTNVFNQDIGNWDVSNVNDMSNMFSYANKFNNNISSWIVSNVNNMSFMFSNDTMIFSIENYDKLLLEWSQLYLQEGVNFGPNYTYYCNSIDERQFIEDTFNWDISDSGIDCESVVINEVDLIDENRYIIKTLDILGRESLAKHTGIFIDIYNDGSTRKRLNIE